MTSGGDDSGVTRILYGLVAAAVLLPCAVLAIGMYLAWQSTLANARLEVVRTVAVATEQATKVLDTDLLVGLRIDDRIGAFEDSAITAQAPALRQIMQAMIQPFPQVHEAAVTGADGRVLVSTQGTTEGFAAHESFLSLRDSAQLYVIESGAAADSAGPMLTLLLRRGGEGGPFRGVIAIVVPGRYLRAFDASLFGGDDALSAGLIRTDGTVLSRFPNPAGDGSDNMMPLLASNQLPNAKSGVIRDDRVAGGVARLVAWQRLDAYPVYATIARSWPSIRLAWKRAVGAHLVFGLPAMLGLATLSVLALQRARRETVALAELRAEVARREAAEGALRQAQKLEAVGRLTAGIAHDFNNHLTIINSNIELLKRRAGPHVGNLARLADAAMAGVKRAATLTQRLLAFSQQQPLVPQPVDVASLVKGLLDRMQRTLGKTIAIRFESADTPWQTCVDANQLENALLTIAANARDAMPQDGAITIAIRNVTLTAADAAARSEVTAGAYVALSVSDTGVGMPPDVLARVFEPFFTTKPIGGGSGLGLSMVYGFARQSGGHVEIASEPGAGTTVTLLLPRHLAALSPAPQPGGGETVLLVDDDAAVRGAAAAALHAAGYTVLQATGAMEAFRLVAERGDVDLLLTDVDLTGGVDGRTLADAARNVNPDIRVMFTTTEDRGVGMEAETACLDDPYVLSKPFDPAGLPGRVRRILDGQS